MGMKYWKYINKDLIQKKHIDNKKNKLYYIENEYSEFFEGNSKYYLSIQSE